jgi:hypothetical protein
METMKRRIDFLSLSLFAFCSAAACFVVLRTSGLDWENALAASVLALISTAVAFVQPQADGVAPRLAIGAFFLSLCFAWFAYDAWNTAFAFALTFAFCIYVNAGETPYMITDEEDWTAEQRRRCGGFLSLSEAFTPLPIEPLDAAKVQIVADMEARTTGHRG